MRPLMIATALLLSLSLDSTNSYAKSPSLIGSWQGGGIVQPTSGAKEKTRCHATILKAPARGQYRANYRCSSSLGVITQAVTVKKTGANHYSGSFNNAQHKIRGMISIILKGNNQTVTMKSANGHGWINMKKR